MASGETDVEKQTDDEADRASRVEAAIAALRQFFQKEDLETRKQRERFAKKCGTSWLYLQQVIQGQRNISPWLAVNLDRESNGELDMTELAIEVDPRHRIDWPYVRRAMRRKAK